MKLTLEYSRPKALVLSLEVIDVNQNVIGLPEAMLLLCLF